MIHWDNILKVVVHSLLMQIRLDGEIKVSWWRHQMETFSALLAICARNSPAPGEFPTQMPVTRSFDVFLDLHPNKRLSKQWWGWWFKTQTCPLWRHSNGGVVASNIDCGRWQKPPISVYEWPIHWLNIDEHITRITNMHCNIHQNTQVWTPIFYMISVAEYAQE